MVLDFGEGETILRIAIALGDNTLHLTVFFEHFSDFSLDICNVGLSGYEFTFPSMLVINSLLVGSFS